MIGTPYHHVRDYRSLNYTRFDLAALAGSSTPVAIPMQKITAAATDATAALKAAGPG